MLMKRQVHVNWHSHQKKRGRCPKSGFIENVRVCSNKASTGNVTAVKKYSEWSSDLREWSFHLSFILIVISRCDVQRYILIGTGLPQTAMARRPPGLACPFIESFNIKGIHLLYDFYQSHEICARAYHWYSIPNRLYFCIHIYLIYMY